MEEKQTNPTQTERSRKKQQQYDFFFELCMKGSADLRKVLKVSDEQYERQHYSVCHHPRDYYLYGAFNDIEKAGTSILRAQEFLGDAKGEAQTDRISQNIIAAVLEEQMLWVRKLTEILTELILFSTINEDIYYRHYMLVKGLKSLKATIVNEEMAYGCITQNYQKQAVAASAEISQLEVNEVDRNKCWYLRNTKKGGRDSGAKASLSDLDERMNQAFVIATQSQLISLGLSTEEGYGSYSIAAHFNPISTRQQRVSFDAIGTAVNRVGLLAGHILSQSRLLLGDNREGFAAFISKGMVDNDEVKKLIDQRIKPEIEAGDFVNAQRELAEVMEIKTGAHGFRSFRVRFLLSEDTEVVGSGDHKTIWTHKNPEFEEYPAMWVAKIYGRQQILNRVRKEILKYDPKAEVSNEILNPLINDSVIELWKNVGLKESVHGKRSEALEKMKKEVERIVSVRQPRKYNQRPS